MTFLQIIDLYLFYQLSRDSWKESFINRLLKFLNKCDILSDSQYGFRKSNSTAYHALTYLYDKISSSIDNKDFRIGIFIDLSKAFDMVDHKILL